MVCDCCKRRKRLFESYALIKTDKKQLHLCVDCNVMLYKLRDAADDKNEKLFNELLVQLENNNKKSTSAFLLWKEEFIKKCKGKFEEAI